jgi:hypothetical protein
MAMEVKQYMTPEGLLEFVLHESALVCLNESMIMQPSMLPLSPPPSTLIDDQLRSRTHRLVRVRCASCDGKR